MFLRSLMKRSKAIANCQLPIFDLLLIQTLVTSNRTPMQSEQSAIGNQKSAMLIECVPNFSEGRKPEVIETIAQAVASIKGVTVLNRHIDPDHNRSVITFVASPDAIVDAALKAVATAAELIDLRSHKGARPFLIAFNINLRTKDLSIARRIAQAVRERDGGLLFVKALGFELQSRGLVQVSMNLIDYEQTTIARAFDAVKAETDREGVEIAGAEIVGLLPRAALDRSAAYFSLLENFRETLVLETLLESERGNE